MTIYSILSQNFDPDNFEILVTGNCDFSLLDSEVKKSIRFIEDKEAAEKGLLGRMLNNLARNAKFENICLMDDDIILTDGWSDRVRLFIEDNSQFDVLSFPIKNVDGSRFWDWAFVDKVSDYSRLLPYKSPSDQVYVTGGMLLVRKRVWEQVKWDGERGFYKREDVDWSERVKLAGYNIDFCFNAFVMHNDWRYSQKGDRVFRDDADTPGAERHWHQLVEEELSANPDATQILHRFLAKSQDNPFPLPGVASPNTLDTNKDYQEETVVVWLGRFSRNIGYAIAAKNYLEAMQAVGQRAVAFDLETMKIAGAGNGVGVSVVHSEEGVQLWCDNPKANFLVVVHELPREYDRVNFRGRVKKVAYFVFETSSIPSDWLVPLRKFDEVWTASSFNRQTFIGAGVPEEKIRVLPHCMPTMLTSAKRGVIKVPGAKNFVFLTVASNFNRKDLGMLLRAYFSTFKKSDQVSLIVKVPRKIDLHLWHQFVLEPIEPEFDIDSDDLPHVHFLEANLSNSRMLDLYNSCDVYVSVERGKGWDLPAMEAMALGKPVIGIDWGGSIDFMNDERSFLLKTDGLTQIDPCLVTGLELYAGHYWANVHDSEMVRCLKEAFEDRELVAKKGRLSREFILKHYDLNTIGLLIKNLAEEVIFAEDTQLGPPILCVEYGVYNTRQAELLHKELNKIKSSKSWKIGHFIVKTIKKLKGLLSIRRFLYSKV